MYTTLACVHATHTMPLLCRLPACLPARPPACLTACLCVPYAHRTLHCLVQVVSVSRWYLHLGLTIAFTSCTYTPW
jgi:hypothetical protein